MKVKKVKMSTKITIPLISEIKEAKKYETKTYKIPYGPANECCKAEIKLKMFKDGSKEEIWSLSWPLNGMPQD